MERIIVGISGASGAILGAEVLRELKKIDFAETHLVISKGGEITITEETDITLDEVKNLADFFYDADNLAAAISSGSFQTKGMIIAPCSMKTLAGIASGYSENLLLRAADVTLKENRPLVLVPREMPLSKIHLKNMLAAKDAGAIILPPTLTFYNKPQTIKDMTDYVVGKILLNFGIRLENLKTWA